MTREQLVAPFPWFGGKRRVTGIVWPRFGTVANYVEPFAGSLAMLLGRYVRVACGDWTRICTDSVTWRHGRTAVFLDPPYSDDVRAKGLYAVDSGDVAAEVLRWCREHGADERLAIALCGYAGEHDELQALGWDVVAWKAHGGYGGQRREGRNENATRERVWFSPGCRPRQQPAQLALDLGG